MKTIVGFIIFSVFLFCGVSGFSADNVKSDFAVYSVYTGRGAEDSALKECEIYINDVIFSTGRLVQVEYLRKMDALRKAGGKDALDLYSNASLDMELSRYFVLKVFVSPGRSALNISVYEKNGNHFQRKKEQTIYTYNYKNLPPRAGLFALEYVKNMPLTASVKKEGRDAMFIINRGQWSGLKPGKYGTDAGEITVVATTRFSSLISSKNSLPGQIAVNIMPETESIDKRLKNELLENDNDKFGIDRALKKRQGPIKESLIGTCIINPGANFCFPVYGSFLSTEYLGIKKAEQHWPGLIIATAVFGGQLAAVPAKSDFSADFFPWIKDSNKSSADQRLQIALWAAIPFTYTASYFDQMSWQFEKKGMLPPAFMNHDCAAALMSAFVPGGGLFYKGYRYTGWLFYTSELSLLSYSVYNINEKKGKYGFAALGLVKAVDVLSALVLSPSYRVYEREYGSGRPSLDFFTAPEITGGTVAGLRLSLNF